MAFAVVLILVSLPLLDAAKETTLDDVFLRNLNLSTRGVTERIVVEHKQQESLYLDTTVSKWPPSSKLYQYLNATEYWILTEFTRIMAAVPVQSIYDDLNEHCSEYEKNEIEDFTVKLKNTSCVQIRLRKMVSSKYKMAVEAGLQHLSNACIRKELPFCLVANRSCTQAYEERVRQILISYDDDWNNVKFAHEETPLDVIMHFLGKDLIVLFQILGNIDHVYYSVFSSNISHFQPFGMENLLRLWSVKTITEIVVYDENNTVSEDESTWGIIKAKTGKFDHTCSTFRDKYSTDSKQYIEFFILCFFMDLAQSNSELINCVYSDPNSPSLKWSTVSSVYFHSECLCLAFKGTECRVKAPQGDDPYFYCLSVLLRDFQRRVSYRPAITYLDYAFQTRVSVCKSSNFLYGAFKVYCNDTTVNSRPNVFLTVQCYFEGLVNKRLNCSEPLIVDNLNYTTLCHVRRFMSMVLCDDENDEEVLVPFYGAGDSSLVLVLTYVDVTVRVLTLVTYLICSDLRNLPGKLLIAYQVTALVRLLVVRAGLEDLQMAVRLDVAMDLSSNLWLTSYLHFLTVSIETLRLPDSLSPDEVRMVLLRYSILGWALPTALSAAFFFMDEAIDSRVQFGQLSFVLCNCVALFANIYMFFKNCHFYYDVKSRARMLLKGVTTRSVLMGLFDFAMKTSVLSGAGITLRLVFTQFQGLQDLLGFYHALGTVQGLLIFFLYGCSREARVFWSDVFRSTLSHCRIVTTLITRNCFELVK